MKELESSSNTKFVGDDNYKWKVFKINWRLGYLMGLILEMIVLNKRVFVNKEER